MRIEDRFVEEDWEREFYKDHMYLLEHEMELNEQYQQWAAQQEESDRQQQQPAEIILEIEKLQENGRVQSKF